PRSGTAAKARTSAGPHPGFSRMDKRDGCRSTSISIVGINDLPLAAILSIELHTTSEIEFLLDSAYHSIQSQRGHSTGRLIDTATIFW
ncbi:MAG TPA: hypothetical protein VGC05_05320, partial [Mycobacterium sp.]